MMLTYIKENLLKPGTQSSQFIRSYIFPIFRKFTLLLEHLNWIFKYSPIPSPATVKHRVLLRFSNPEAQWIESGTWLGDTADFLSKRFSKVITIEPGYDLYVRALDRLNKRKNVVIINNTSENSFQHAIDKVDNVVCFWLDGHYSGNGTFKGGTDTPLEFEIDTVIRNIKKFREITIFIDDVRLFDDGLIVTSDTYPSRNIIIKTMVKNGFKWHLEHDILIFRKFI